MIKDYTEGAETSYRQTPTITAHVHNTDHSTSGEKSHIALNYLIPAEVAS